MARTIPLASGSQGRSAPLATSSAARWLRVTPGLLFPAGGTSPVNIPPRYTVVPTGCIARTSCARPSGPGAVPQLASGVVDAPDAARAGVERGQGRENGEAAEKQPRPPQNGRSGRHRPRSSRGEERPASLPGRGNDAGFDGAPTASCRFAGNAQRGLRQPRVVPIRSTTYSCRMTTPTGITSPGAARRSHRCDPHRARRRARAADQRDGGRRPSRRAGRSPDRALRRPGPPVRRLLDRHRPEHGCHQAGSPETLHPQGPRRRVGPEREAGLQPLHPPGEERPHRRPQRGPRRRARSDPTGAPRARPTERTRRPGRQGHRRPGRAARHGPPGGDRCSAPAGRRRSPISSPTHADSRKALELTFREALRLGHNYIGTEHILLALLELEDDDGVLAGLGLDKPAAEAHITAGLAASR